MTGTSSSETRPERELTITKDGEIVAHLDGETFFCRLLAIHGKMAVRAFAYSLAAEDPKTAKQILKIVGREGL